MKRNLLESFDEEVKPALFAALKGNNPTTEDDIFQHLSIVHASILGSLIQRSKKGNGAKAIKDLLELGNHNGDIIDQVEEIFGNEKKRSELKKLGNSLLSFIFDKGADTAFEKIQHFLSQKYVTTEEKLIDVNRIVAPYSMALIGRIVHLEKMSEEEISALLLYNEPFIGQRYPGLAQIFGLRDLIEVETSTAPDQSPGLDTRSKDSKKEDDQVQKNMQQPDSSVEAQQERKDFIKALWPWVLILGISILALYLIKKYQYVDPQSPVVDNTFPFVQDDSLTLDTHKTYTLPNSEILTVESNSTLNALMMHLEEHQKLVDTLRYQTNIIAFQDASSILATPDNHELADLISILKAYPNVKLGVNMVFDSTFYLEHSNIVSERATHLSHYFNVFGLNNSRYDITTTVVDINSDIIEPSTEGGSPDSTQTNSDQMIEMLFYQKLLSKPDSTLIE